MTSLEIKQKVLTEIEQHPKVNSHLDLDKCLLPEPVQVEMLNAHDSTETIKAWLVLEEKPDTPGFYGIAYDESYGKFGLCLKDKAGKWSLLSYYQSFVEAVEGM